MDPHQRDHICSHLYELTKYTFVNSLFVTYLKSQEAFSSFDTAELDAIGNRFDKTKRFYEIVVTCIDSYDALCKALEKTTQSGALKILNELKNDGYLRLHGKTKGIRFGVEAPAFLFTGRKKELNNLDGLLRKTENLATVVVGRRGIGKTELCRKYIERFCAKFENNVIWIDGKNMTKDFKTVAKDNLKIKLKDVDKGEKEIITVVDEVYKFFPNEKCLFVFDNIESSTLNDLDIFLPTLVPMHNKPPVLIISSDPNWDQSEPFGVLKLEKLEENDAIEFIKKGASIEDDSQDEHVSQLVNRVSRIPSLLTEAVAFITKQRTTRDFGVKKFLDGDCHKKLASFETNTEVLSSEPSEEVYV